MLGMQKGSRNKPQYFILTDKTASKIQLNAKFVASKKVKKKKCSHLLIFTSTRSRSGRIRRYHRFLLIFKCNNNQEQKFRRFILGQDTEDQDHPEPLHQDNTSWKTITLPGKRGEKRAVLTFIPPVHGNYVTCNAIHKKAFEQKFTLECRKC